MVGHDGLVYDYMFSGLPDYEDLKDWGVDVKEPETYKMLISHLLTLNKPRLGTVTIAFTGSRRHNSRILPKRHYVESVLFALGYYLRDVKIVQKSTSYNAYSVQAIDVLTFQRGSKGLYNRGGALWPAEYGRDVWGPFGRETVIDGEVVGAPLEIATRCIKQFTNPYHIVYDPFAGVGTTLEAARRLGRPFIGFEIRPAVHAAGLLKYPELSGEKTPSED